MCAVGCTETATPAELSHPQLLGIRAEPPLIAPGQRCALSSLLAGPEGEITDVTASWKVVGAPGKPPIGHVETTASGVEYVAPDSVMPEGDEPIAVAAVEMTVEVDGYTLVGQKLVGVGPGVHENPMLVEVTIDGDVVDDTAEVTIPVGATVPITATAEPSVKDNGQIAWYATAGEIEIYRGPQTELRAPDSATGAVMFVIARDGLGGIAWRQIPLRFAK